MTANQESQEQAAVVAKLERKGFCENFRMDTVDGHVEVGLSKRVRSTTYYAEVDHAGLVNGEPLSAFLASIK